MQSKFEYVIVALVWVAAVAMIVGLVALSFALFQLPGLFCFLGLFPIAIAAFSLAFGLWSSR